MRAFKSVKTSCKYDGWLKSFASHYIRLKIFIICLSVKGTFLVYSCEQVVEIVIYDIIHHRLTVTIRAYDSNFCFLARYKCRLLTYLLIKPKWFSVLTHAAFEPGWLLHGTFFSL